MLVAAGVKSLGDDSDVIIVVLILPANLLITDVILLSYNRGLMTELIGKMMIENRAYHGEASITPSVWRKQTVMNGIQQRKSEVLMREIFLCIALFL